MGRASRSSRPRGGRGAYLARPGALRDRPREVEGRSGVEAANQRGTATPGRDPGGDGCRGPRRPGGLGRVHGGFEDRRRPSGVARPAVGVDGSTALRRTWRSGSATMRSVPRPRARRVRMCRSRGLADLENRQTPKFSRKSPGSFPGSGLHISLALLWLSGLDRTAPRRKARRGGGWERPPSAATLCVTRGGGSFPCSFPRQPAPRGGRSHRNYPCGKAARRAALDHNPAPRPWRGTAPVSFLEDALSRVSPGLLYALVAALSVELAAVLLLDFPPFGLVPILDLISLEISAFLRRDPGLVLSRSGQRRLRGEPRPRRARHSLFQPRRPRGIRPNPRRRHSGAGARSAGP